MGRCPLLVPAPVLKVGEYAPLHCSAFSVRPCKRGDPAAWLIAGRGNQDCGRRPGRGPNC
jgi:hypothetical protein